MKIGIAAIGIGDDKQGSRDLCAGFPILHWRRSTLSFRHLPNSPELRITSIVREGKSCEYRSAMDGCFSTSKARSWCPMARKMRERPTLLLLHGGPGFDHSTFKPDLSPLAEVAQVIYLDHRSNGRSDRTPPDRWTLANWAEDVRAFCEALEIEKPIVMGTSFGGFVAMAYGTRHPEHPGKLIFCTTSAKWRSVAGTRCFRTPRRQGSARRRRRITGRIRAPQRSPTTFAYASRFTITNGAAMRCSPAA